MPYLVSFRSHLWSRPCISPVSCVWTVFSSLELWTLPDTLQTLFSSEMDPLTGNPGAFPIIFVPLKWMMHMSYVNLGFGEHCHRDRSISMLISCCLCLLSSRTAVCLRPEIQFSARWQAAASPPSPKTLIISLPVNKSQSRLFLEHSVS